MRKRRTRVDYGTGQALSGTVTAGFDALEGTGRAVAVTIEPGRTVVRYGNERTQVDVWYDSELCPQTGALIEQDALIDATIRH